MLISAHIPKTAGVSFRNILCKQYGSSYFQYYWKITNAFGEVVDQLPATAGCVHGHFVASDLVNRFPNSEVVTWVRDPVDRVLSSYYYRLREPDWQHPVCRQLHEEKLDIIEYARLELVRNEMARFMGTLRPEDFDFIGITERFEQSLAWFCQRFNLPKHPVRRDNCNPDHVGTRYVLKPEIRAEILRLNEADEEIYRKCLERTFDPIAAVA